MSAQSSSRAPLKWCVTLAFLGAGAGAALAEAIQAPAQDAYLFGSASVIDGDTIEIAGNSIRLADIDSPPLSYSCHEGAVSVPCGARAALFLRELVGISPVTCIPEGHDAYTREVARCSVKGADLGAAMVRAGWAIARYGTTYEAEQADAKAKRTGLWAYGEPPAFVPGATPPTTPQPQKP